MSSVPNSIPPISSLLVVGAGWVGRQIAAQAAGHGLAVSLVDVNPNTTQSALQWINSHIQKQIAEGRWSQLDKPLHITAIESDSISKFSFDWVIESVVEQVSIKRRVLKDLSDATSPDTIISSNSSYFVPSMLAKYLKHPERFAHVHFHVPVWISTVSDIVPCEATSETVLDRLMECCHRIGQTPILERKENPGYIFNWLLQSLLGSALELTNREVADAETVDFVWKKLTGMPLGPFGIMDQIGLDVIHQVMANARWTNQTIDLQRLMDLLQPKIDAGHLGAKTGEGFFKY